MFTFASGRTDTIPAKVEFDADADGIGVKITTGQGTATWRSTDKNLVPAIVVTD